MATIRVITFRVDEQPNVEEIPVDEGGSLSGLQKIVGGWIERVPPVYWKAQRGLDLWCNEEGFCKGLQPQVRRELGQRAPLAGNLVLARSNADGDTIGVTDDDVVRYCGAIRC